MNDATTPDRPSPPGADHPLRFVLNDEVHARPPERIVAPARASFIARMVDGAQRGAAWDILTAAAAATGAPLPDPAGAHYSADFGRYRVKAERHTEFMRLKVIVPGLGPGGAAAPFEESALAAARAGWVSELPGQTLVATHAAVLPAGAWPPDTAAAGAALGGPDPFIGSMIADGAGAAFTDFRIRADGFGRLLLVDRALTPGQAGRTLQRVLEIDTYRMLALLALPLARARMGELVTIERDLAAVTEALVAAREEDDPKTLDALIALAARIQHGQSESQFRFSAAASYYELVERRIMELREQRLEGLQTFGEFMERRLAPAMRTCLTVTDRQEALSARVARTTELLSTRVEISAERQSHAVLESMNRRAHLQLRLQETVEGLSVAAITYYIVSLVGRAAEALEAMGAHVSPTIAEGAAIPIVALFVAYGVRRIRRRVARAAE